MTYATTVPVILSSTMTREELDNHWSLALDEVELDGAIDLIREGARVVRTFDRPDFLALLLDLMNKEGSALSRHQGVMLKSIDYLRRSKLQEA